ncbi:DUF393 domain-containing protein [candidate division KSB1 bacterium]|nr:DUF393 domain-containing protein [candidate division KSB1 bacterium]
MTKLFTRLIQAWDKYWFMPGSLTRLAIYRIWVFSIILIDVLVWTRGHLRYADVDPQFYQPIYLLRLFNIPASAHPWLDIVYGALAIFVFLALIGFKTNFSAVMASGLYVYWVTQWFSSGWVHHPLVFSMTVLALSPSGARLSADHLLKRLRENHAAQRFISKNKAADTSPYATWSLKFVQAIIILVYFFHLVTFITMRTFFEFLWLTYPVFFNFEKIGAWIRRHITAPRGITKFAVLFDGQCPLCIRSVTTVDFLDWRGKFVFRDVNDWEQISRDYPGLDQQKSLEEMQVTIPRPGGYEALAGFYAFRKIAQHLPLGMLVWPFLFIPGVPFLGTRIYRFIASRRKRVTGGARCSFHTCEVPIPVKNL